MKEIVRIQKMEQALDDITSTKIHLKQVLDEFYSLQPKISELFKYYGSKDFHHDLWLDEQGKLPQNLKRGVLSEDAVYNLLSDLQNLIQDMHDLANSTQKNIEPE